MAEPTNTIGETLASGIAGLTGDIWSDVDWVSPVPMARHMWCRLGRAEEQARALELQQLLTKLCGYRQ